MTTESLAHSVHAKSFDNCCPECGCRNLQTDYSRGEILCQMCGLVIDGSLVDMHAEPNYGDEKSRERMHYGAPSNRAFPGNGLSTEISSSNRDGNGNLIPMSNQIRFRRLRTIQHRNRVQNAAERCVRAASSEIDRLIGRMGLSDRIRERSTRLYGMSVKRNLIKGRSIDGVAAACVYAACRQQNVPRTLDEVAACTRIGKKELGRIYRFISRTLRFGLRPTKAQEYVGRFSSELGLNAEAENMAKEMLERSEHLALSSGKIPTGLAAGALFLSAAMCGQHRTKKRISDVTGVTEVTIRHRSNELVQLLGIDPASFSI